MSTPASDDLLSPSQVHSEYGFATASTLANWRWLHQGPDYIKTSQSRAGRIRYRRSVIEAWLKENSHQAMSPGSWTPAGVVDAIKAAHRRLEAEEITNKQFSHAVGRILYPTLGSAAPDA